MDSDPPIPDSEAEDTGPVDVVDPGPPDFPSTIGTLSVAVRTGSGTYDGTDDNTLSLCLSDTDCFSLNVADVDDFRRGEHDVYHFEGVGLRRARVDRVELRSVSGADMWRPDCLEVRFDGEPVYCSAIDVKMGDGGGDEVESWVDPDGLHNACDTCYPSTLTHGPYVGNTTPDGATVWVRTDATRPVALRVARDPAEVPTGRVVAWVYPSPLDDFGGKLTLTDAEPGTRYHYGVEVDGGPVQVAGSFTTAPARGQSGRTRIAYGSCSKLDSQPIFSAIEALKPDLFFFVGDNHYANSDDRDSLRWYYRWGLERPQRASLLAHTPTLATWDDHDYVGNNTDGTAPGKDVALRAFKEHWANPRFGTNQTPGVFFVHRHGDLAFFFLDDRYWRGLDNSILGDGQTAWLKSELAASDATFKLLISGSRFTSYGSSDSWAAFPAATADLFDYLRDEGIGGVVLLSGDIHRSDFRLIPRSGTYALPELTSSPLAYSLASPCLGSDPEQLTCYSAGMSFVTLDIDTGLADPTLTARLHDVNGAVVFKRIFARSELEP